ncbi:unnamed protein product [[Candida] boidinii]|uniref:Unnamed protein product n=1 Tax=Candida boidinii TaxID=5477 RepID=A0ACB5TFI1_CANBO|nr:unnamed protein product [[Candida] boidinii]
MSFIGGGSECAAGSNPLSQFTKHTQNDTSLQQSIQNQQNQQIQQNQQFFHQPNQLRNVNLMSEKERLHMNEFMKVGGANGGANGAFGDFKPMTNELNMIHRNHPQQQQQHNLINDFKQMNVVNNNTTPNAAAINMKMSDKSSWGSEFSQNVTNIPQQQQQQPGAPQQMRQPIMQNRMFAGGMMGGGGYMSRMQQPILQQQNQQNQKASTSTTEVENQKEWEDTFKELEKANDDGQLEEIFEAKSEDQQKFNEVWSEIQETYADKELSNDDYQAQWESNLQEMNELQQSYDDIELTNDEFQAQWEKDFEKYAQTRLNYGEYHFEKENEFINKISTDLNAYEIGLKLMESGAKLSEAALAFEAAVQENPQHADAWLKLGEVQTQNEKEIAGISALEKCLEIEPRNLKALMTLAISYVNEGYDNAAYATLERWLETKYPEIAENARSDNPELESDDRITLNRRITNLFIKAAQISPDITSMDADVQTGLGVLFYSTEDFDKTIDCFKAAIEANPDDALNWNRLGASLANSNRPEQAVEAYTKALQLNPNFVRARYNLGVSFINMGLYQDAVEHLLTGLSMHEVENSNGEAAGVADTNQSTSLIETLKRAFLAMDRRDLIDKVKPGMNIASFRTSNGI